MKKILITLLCLPFIMFAQNSDKKSSQEEFPTIEIKDEMPATKLATRFKLTIIL